MKFESNLSSKDKKTIAIVLGAAFTFMFFWSGIRPTINSIKDLDEQIDKATLQKTEYKNKIINLSSAETVFNRAVSDLADTTEEFYPMMQSSDIDRMMTSYVLGFGLYPESMNITMPLEPVEEAPYIYSDVEVNTVVITPTPTPTPAPTGADTASSSSDTNAFATPEIIEGLNVPYNRARSSAVSTAPSGVYCVELSYTVTGSQEDCQALIDDLSDKPSVRLTGFEWSTIDPIAVANDEEGTIEYVESDQVRLRVDINLYMTDVADYEAMVEEAVDSAVVEE